MSIKSKLVQGGGGTAIPAGYIGYQLTATGNDVTTDTSTNTSIASLTLPVGVWSVSVTSESRGALTQQGAIHSLEIKGTTSSTKGKDVIQVLAMPAGSSHAVTFATHVVNIASGDSNKTVRALQQSYLAAGLGCAHISAILIG